MKRLQFLCIIFILCSCGQPTESAPTDEPFASRPYFDFDKIIHYHIDINEDEVMTLNTKTSKTRLDSLLADILIQYANENLTDTTLLNSLESLPFKKTVIDSLLFKDFREIFSEKKHVDPIYSSCLATWRDILIFKKSQSTIGIAKICFDCNRSSIVGTKVNTEEFGQSGDYQKLFRLLNRK